MTRQDEIVLEADRNTLVRWLLEGRAPNPWLAVRQARQRVFGSTLACLVAHWVFRVPAAVTWEIWCACVFCELLGMLLLLVFDALTDPSRCCQHEHRIRRHNGWYFCIDCKSTQQEKQPLAG